LCGASWSAADDVELVAFGAVKLIHRLFSASERICLAPRRQPAGFGHKRIYTAGCSAP
jgi:hypothetical protein